MHSTLEIAIIDPNTLAALGLRTILEEMLPETVVRTFSSYAALMDDTPDMYAHYFVSSHIYFEHTAFFLERRPKTIVLTTGEVSLPVPTLDISLPQDVLVARIVNLRQHGHEHHTRPASDASAPTTNALSPREAEVLTLVARGLMNKEIADRLHIGLTTVISHRRNISAKLGIRSASGLAIYAVMHGLVEADSI